MTIMRLLRSISPIGLDIGPRTICAVQGQRTGSGWRVTAAAVVQRIVESEGGGGPEGAADGGGCWAAPLTVEELSRLQDILYRQGFTGRDVVICAADREVLSGTPELPPAHSGAPLEQLARRELARLHRRELEQLETAAWHIPAPARSRHFSYLMAVGVPRQEIEAQLDALEALAEGGGGSGGGDESARRYTGFSVLAMEIRATAMARACAPVVEEEGNVSAILDLGEADAVLSVVKHGPRGGVVVYERVMSDCGGAGIGLLRMKLRQELNLPADVADHMLEVVGLGPAVHGGGGGTGAARDEDEDSGTRAKAAELIRDFFPGLIQELRTALAYAVHRYPSEVDRVLAVGTGAAVPGLIPWISEELGLEIGIVSPAGVATCPEWLVDQCADPSLTTALGLAQHGMSPAGSPRRSGETGGAAINLIPAKRVRARQRVARIRTWMSIVPALATILMGSYGWLRTVSNTDTQSLQALIHETATASAALEESIGRDRAQISQQHLRLLANRAVGEQPDWGVLLFIVGSHLGDDVVLSTCQLEPLTDEGRKVNPQALRPEQYRLTLIGLGRDQSAVSAFVLALDGMAPPKIFERVRLVESRRVPLAGKDAVQFRIECTLTDLVGEGADSSPEASASGETIR
jgi:hypothetical protein